MKFDRAIEFLEQGIAHKHFPSAVLAIGEKEDLFVCEARGFISQNSEVTASLNTIYDMASLTKILSTTMVTLKLIEKGILCLSDTIGCFFETPEDKKDITILNLMTHTSGMTAGFRLGNLIDSPNEALDAILNYPLQAMTGGQVIYSDFGYIILGKILEKICQMPLDKIADEYVFHPLEMHSTGYHPKGETAPTELDSSTGRYIDGFVHDNNARFLNGISGNAGVFSNIKDCIKFSSMLSRSGITDKGRFLSAATMKAATRNYTKGKSENRGLGFKLSGGEGNFMGDLCSPNVFGHTGFTGTSMVIDPDTGLYIVLLTNRVHPTRENTGIIRFRKTLHNIIMAEYTS